MRPVVEIEERLNDVSDLYSVTIGASEFGFFSGGGQARRAEFFVTLRDDAPEDIAGILREELDKPGQVVSITELVDGPPAGGVDIVVTGPDYDDIAAVSRDLATSLGAIEDIVNVENTVTQARPEVAIEVDPEKAAFLGLTTRQVAFQLSQYLIGQTVTTITIDGRTYDVVVAGDPRASGGLSGVGSLIIAGQVGSAPLGEIAELAMREGPVEISRTDGVRSASITGDIISDDAQAVGVLVQEKIDALQLPPGVSVESGGIFADIAEGFQAVFISMAVGIVLVYLVMVASLGSLRNPFVIITTLPLALIGVFVSLAVTGRSLGLPAMMGMLLLIGIVVTNAIVLIAFVEQQRAKGMAVYDALVSGAPSAAAPHPDDRSHHELRSPAARSRERGQRRHHQRGTGDGRHRRPDELYWAHPARPADCLHAVQRQHPQALEQALPPFAACPRAGNRIGKLIPSPSMGKGWDGGDPRLRRYARFSSSHAMTMGRPFTAASSMSGNSSANSNVAISCSPQSGSRQRTTSSPTDWNASR